MGFLDPAFLLGLGALAVPIALHLLFRRRVQVMEFPLVRLIEAAERTRQPRRRLNRVLLLIARATMLALLALALARLVLGGGTSVAADGPAAIVVVVDDSLSQRARVAEAVTSLEAGAAQASDLLASLPAGSEVAVVIASSPREAATSGLSPEVGAARRMLEDVEPGWEHVRLAPALREARALVQESPLPEKRVVLVTDLARHALEGLGPAPAGAAPALTIFAPEIAERTNRSVSGLELATLPDGRLRATARVSAWGGAAPDLPVELHVGPLGEPARLAARADVSPEGGASEQRRFDLAAPLAADSPGGATWAAAELRLPEDFLPADDRRAAVSAVVSPPRILVVDGDPQNLSFGSETFYVERAFAPGVGLDLRARFVTAAELEPEDFSSADVVVLANVAELSHERVRALREAVEAGTGLVVSVGDRTDLPTWNGRLAPLMPATLGVARRHGDGASIRSGEAELALPLVTVRRSLSLVPEPGARVLARLAGGEPVLVQGRLGEGRVVLLGTTLDRDWTDLPISPHFLAFLRELVRLASARVDVTPLGPVVAGEAVDLSPLMDDEPGARPPVVVDPDGRRLAVADDLLFDQAQRPGVHRVERDGRVVGAFAVVTDPRESDLARLSPAGVEGLLGGWFALDATGGLGGPGGSGGGRPAWPWILVGLVALAGVESHLARRAS